jgi:hypothetical protein
MLTLRSLITDLLHCGSIFPFKRRIDINKIDTRTQEVRAGPAFFPIRKPFQVVAEIEAIHSVEMFTVRSAIAPVASGSPRLEQFGFVFREPAG